jgi:hypothetical protein
VSASRRGFARSTSSTKARWYFAVQSVGGIAWWIAVFASDDVREWTLGGWSPALLVVPDLVLFSGGSRPGSPSLRRPVLVSRNA